MYGLLMVMILLVGNCRVIRGGVASVFEAQGLLRGTRDHLFGWILG